MTKLMTVEIAVGNLREALREAGKLDALGDDLRVLALAARSPNTASDQMFEDAVCMRTTSEWLKDGMTNEQASTICVRAREVARIARNVRTFAINQRNQGKASDDSDGKG